MPGGFLVNGASRGSAPAVWFINAASAAARPPPSPPPHPPLLPTAVMDWAAVGSCLLRKLFLAAGMSVNAVSSSSSPISPPAHTSHFGRIPPIIFSRNNCFFFFVFNPLRNYKHEILNIGLNPFLDFMVDMSNVSLYFLIGQFFLNTVGRCALRVRPVVSCVIKGKTCATV